MTKNICLAVGLAGLLFGIAPSTVHADGRIRYRGWGSGPHWEWNGGYFIIDIRPSFIVLSDYGFSVSVGNPYDIIYYDNLYYTYVNNYWYSSPAYRWYVGCYPAG